MVGDGILSAKIVVSVPGHALTTNFYVQIGKTIVFGDFNKHFNRSIRLF